MTGLTSRKTLFDLHDEMYQLMEYGCNADGEVAQTQEEFNKMYDEIQVEITTKIDNTNSIVKMIDGDNSLIDVEIDRLQRIKKQNENYSKWLTNRVDFVLRQQFTDEYGVLDVDALKDAVKNLNKKLKHSAISYTKSSSIEITNPDEVPTDMKTIKVEEAPSKTKIKEYLKSIDATECEFAKIKENLSIKIK